MAKNDDNSKMNPPDDKPSGKAGRGNREKQPIPKVASNPDKPVVTGASRTTRYIIAAATISALLSFAALGVLLKSRQPIAMVPPVVTPMPDPAKPDPAKPDPAKPDPAKPDPAKPDPAKPDPVKPDPVKPDPVKPDPVKPDPIAKKPGSIFGGAKPPVTTTKTGATPGTISGGSKPGSIFGGLKPLGPLPTPTGTSPPPVTKTSGSKPGGLFGGLKPTGVSTSTGSSKPGNPFGGLNPKGKPPTVLTTSGPGGNGGIVRRPPLFTKPNTPWNGGFTNVGGTPVVTVVNPGSPIFTISPSDFLDGGFVITFASTPKSPIPPKNVPIWNNLLSTAILEILNRLNLSGGNGASGPLVASAANLNGLTFVRKGFLGVATNRLSFTNNSFTTSLPTPASSGSYSVTPNRITLNRTTPSVQSRSMVVSGFQRNSSGLRSIKLDNVRWEEEKSTNSVTPGSLTASNRTLGDKVFILDESGNKKRLQLLSTNRFEYVIAPVSSSKPRAAIQSIKGTFLATASSLTFTLDSGSVLPKGVANVWPIANFLRKPDGKHSIQLVGNIWDEEATTPVTPIGPLEASVATLGGMTLSFTDSGVTTQRLELLANGSVTYKVINGTQNGSFNGTYTVNKTELSLTFPTTNAPANLLPVWLYRNFQLNSDGIRSIEIQNLNAPPPVAPKSGININAPATFQVWDQIP